MRKILLTATLLTTFATQAFAYYETKVFICE